MVSTDDLENGPKDFKISSIFGVLDIGFFYEMQEIFSRKSIFLLQLEIGPFLYIIKQQSEKVWKLCFMRILTFLYKVMKTLFLNV